jgi:hypothetical protein
MGNFRAGCPGGRKGDRVETSAPGWYADPTGRHDYRYWTGAKWSGRVADGAGAGEGDDEAVVDVDVGHDGQRHDLDHNDDDAGGGGSGGGGGSAGHHEAYDAGHVDVYDEGPLVDPAEALAEATLAQSLLPRNIPPRKPPRRRPGGRLGRGVHTFSLL